MTEVDRLLIAYVAFGIAIQVLLTLNFAARNWRPELERSYGWIIYASGLISLALGVLMWIDARPWYFIAGPLLFSVWSALGFWVDIWRPVAWRSPPRWNVFGPYVGVYVASLLLYWGSMWTVGSSYWIAFGALYALHTALNIYSHRMMQQATGSREAGQHSIR